MSFEISVVQTPSTFSVDETFNDSRFMKVRVAAMHTKKNNNNSYFSRECVLAAKDTFANIPILADVITYTDEDGNTHMDYSGHSMHIEDDAFNPNEKKVIYDEKVVGIIPESNNFELVYDEATDREFVVVDCLIFRDYGNYVCDILEERGGKTDVSMEILCEDLSFSIDEKALVVGKMTASGCTLLGEHVAPGMAGAHATVFSIDSTKKESEMIRIMQELKESLDNYTAIVANENARKEESEVTKFEELCEKYNKTVDEIEFEYESLTDEELESAFALAFEDGDDDNATDDGDSTDDTEGGSGDDTTTEPEAPEIPEVEPKDDVILDDVEDVKADDPDGQDDAAATTVPKLSVEFDNKTFSVSLAEKIYAIQALVNETYSDLDGDYYSCDVFEEDGYVVMHGWSRSYRQQFKKKKNCNSYSLIGDRVEVFCKYLTEDEITALDNMKSSYAEIASKLEKYETEPQKVEILNSGAYKYVRHTEEFANLCVEENHFDLTVDEVKTKANDILFKYAEAGELNFSSDQNNESVHSNILPRASKASGRYGDIFS